MILTIGGQTNVGKTLVTKFIEKKYSAWILHLDELAKKMYQKPEVKKKLAKEFSSKIFNDKKEINLVKVKKIVFENENNFQKLNKIIFPFLKKAAEEAVEKNKNDLKIIEGATVFKIKWKTTIDANILLKSKLEKQQARNQKDGKFNSDELIKIIKIQKKMKWKKTLNYYTIENNESLIKLKKEFTKLINNLRKKITNLC